MFHKLVKLLKVMPDDKRIGVIDEIELKYGDLYDGQPVTRKALSMPITRSQLVELAENGVEIGSHTLTHPNLTKLNDDKLSDELNSSRSQLESMIGRPIYVFAYPFGMKYAVNDHVQNVVKLAGYKIGVTYQSGTNILNNSTNYFTLKRHHVDLSTNHQVFSSMLALPELIS